MRKIIELRRMYVPFRTHVQQSTVHIWANPETILGSFDLSCVSLDFAQVCMLLRGLDCGSRHRVCRCGQEQDPGWVRRRSIMYSLRKLYGIISCADRSQYSKVGVRIITGNGAQSLVELFCHQYQCFHQQSSSHIACPKTTHT